MICPFSYTGDHLPRWRGLAQAAEILPVPPGGSDAAIVLRVRYRCSDCGATWESDDTYAEVEGGP